MPSTEKDIARPICTINRAHIRRFIQRHSSGTRVSKEYLDRLNAEVKAMIRDHLHRNGSKRTLRPDVFMQMNGKGEARG